MAFYGFQLIIMKIMQDTIADCFLKTEVRMKVLNSKCHQLKKERNFALQEQQKVALMSEDQLQKLHSLESVQDLMEVQNLKLKEDLLHYKIRNTALLNNIADLRSQLSVLKEEKENISREISWGKSQVQKRKEKTEETENMVQELENNIARLETIIEENCQEMFELQENSKKQIHLLEENHVKEKTELMAQIALFASEIKTMKAEKIDIDSSVGKLKEEIAREAENLKFTKKRKLKREIEELKFLMKLTQTPDDERLYSANSSYILKLKHQLEEALDDLRTSRRQNRKLSEEKQQIEEIMEANSKATDDLRENYRKLIRENFKSSSLIKDLEEEFKQVLAKYEKTVSAMSSQQYILENQSQTMAELDKENLEMKEKLKSLVGKQVETSLIDSEKYLRVKISSLEANFEFESENVKRLTSVNDKLKQKLERSETDCADLLRKAEETSRANKTLRSELRTFQAECLSLQNKQLTTGELRARAEQNLKMSEAEVSRLRLDLDSANRRIKHLHLEMFLNSDHQSDLSSEDEEIFGK